MRQIIKIKTIKSDFSIEDLWSAYLFSTVFLYLIKNNLDLKSSNIVVGTGLLPDLQERVTIALGNLLKDGYLEPSIYELQKHPTRFETILLNGRKYKVNYRLSEIGRMAYAIYCLVNFINDAISEGHEVYLEFN